MILGGTVTGFYSNVHEWEQILLRSEFKAITAPFNCNTDKNQISSYLNVLSKHHVQIAEIGVWKNVLDPNPAVASEAVDFAKKQLALAERLRIPCCVNIAGTPGSSGWDAADPQNFTPETYDRTVSVIREIIDSVLPAYSFYCLEPMPWMIPDGPDEYLQLIKDVDRPQFAVHMDFVNLINCPRRYLAADSFIEDCFRKLGPYIKSTHIKDSRMHPTNLTVLLEECSPGEGNLDFVRILRILDRYLPKNGPVLLEHMQTEEEYRTSYLFLKRKSAEAGICI